MWLEVVALMVRFKLAKLLLEKGISNKSKFAREIEMNRWGLTKLIQNENPKQIESFTIEKLCRALDCLPNDLFEIVNEGGTPFLPKYTILLKRKHRKVNLNTAVARLSKKQKMALTEALLLK
jgi:DNA-binding Xre family transcriptional regulator